MKNIKYLWIFISTLLAGVLLTTFTFDWESTSGVSILYDIGIGVIASTLVGFAVYIITLLHERRVVLINTANSIELQLRSYSLEIQELCKQRKSYEADYRNKNNNSLEGYNEFDCKLDSTSFEQTYELSPIFIDIGDDKLRKVFSDMNEVATALNCDLGVVSYARLIEYSSKINKLRIRLAKWRTDTKNR